MTQNRIKTAQGTAGRPGAVERPARPVPTRSRAVCALLMAVWGLLAAGCPDVGAAWVYFPVQQWTNAMNVTGAVSELLQAYQERKDIMNTNLRPVWVESWRTYDTNCYAQIPQTYTSTPSLTGVVYAITNGGCIPSYVASPPASPFPVISMGTNAQHTTTNEVVISPWYQRALERALATLDTDLRYELVGYADSDGHGKSGRLNWYALPSSFGSLTQWFATAYVTNPCWDAAAGVWLDAGTAVKYPRTLPMIAFEQDRYNIPGPTIPAPPSSAHWYLPTPIVTPPDFLTGQAASEAWWYTFHFTNGYAMYDTDVPGWCVGQWGTESVDGTPAYLYTNHTESLPMLTPEWAFPSNGIVLGEFVYDACPFSNDVRAVYPEVIRMGTVEPIVPGYSNFFGEWVFKGYTSYPGTGASCPLWDRGTNDVSGTTLVLNQTTWILSNHHAGPMAGDVYYWGIANWWDTTLLDNTGLFKDNHQFMFSMTPYLLACTNVQYPGFSDLYLTVPEGSNWIAELGWVFVDGSAVCERYDNPPYGSIERRIPLEKHAPSEARIYLNVTNTSPVTWTNPVPLLLSNSTLISYRVVRQPSVTDDTNVVTPDVASGTNMNWTFRKTNDWSGTFTNETVVDIVWDCTDWGGRPVWTNLLRVQFDRIVKSSWTNLLTLSNRGDRISIVWTNPTPTYGWFHKEASSLYVAAAYDHPVYPEALNARYALIAALDQLGIASEWDQFNHYVELRYFLTETSQQGVTNFYACATEGELCDHIDAGGVYPADNYTNAGVVGKRQATFTFDGAWNFFGPPDGWTIANGATLSKQTPAFPLYIPGLVGGVQPTNAWVTRCTGAQFNVWVGDNRTFTDCDSVTEDATSPFAQYRALGYDNGWAWATNRGFWYWSDATIQQLDWDGTATSGTNYAIVAATVFTNNAGPAPTLNHDALTDCGAGWGGSVEAPSHFDIVSPWTGPDVHWNLIVGFDFDHD